MRSVPRAARNRQQRHRPSLKISLEESAPQTSVQLPPHLPEGTYTAGFSEEFFTGLLGSGPRGRRFKSTRPDHFSKEESGRPWQQGLFHVRLTLLGRAGECFEMWGAFVPVTS